MFQNPPPKTLNFIDKKGSNRYNIYCAKAQIFIYISYLIKEDLLWVKKFPGGK